MDEKQKPRLGKSIAVVAQQIMYGVLFFILDKISSFQRERIRPFALGIWRKE